MSTTLLLSIGTFVAILALLLFLRTRNSKLEIRTTDIVVATLPVLIYLLVTGSIQKLEFGESGVKIETAFVKATTEQIDSQVAPLVGLPLEPTSMDSKRGVEEIPRLLERKTEGLVFRLGYSGYYGPAIQEFLARLTAQPYLKYIVIQNSDGSFFGMADARQLSDMLSNPYGPVKADEVARWLSNSNRASFTKLPGFVSFEHAVKTTADKREALQMMEQQNIDILPVMNEKDIYVGIVNRARLTASLILDVSKALKQ